MDKKDLSYVAKNALYSVRKYSPEILVGVGITGMLSGAVLAVKVTPKAVDMIRAKETLKKEALTKKEVIKTTWKLYIPSVAITFASIGCIVGASSVSLKRNAALATAYTLSETALTEYKNKVVETFGEKKARGVNESIAKDKLDDNPVVDREIVITEKGNTLCFDTLSSRYFKSDIETIRRIEVDIKRRLCNEMYISLNEFYYELGLDGTKLGNLLGWSFEDDFDLYFSSQLSKDDTPCLVMDYRQPPKYEFDK